MVGCGGFGPATAGIATIASAAAKEPAIVAAVKTLLEFIADPFQKPGVGRSSEVQRRPTS
jgi:hypothetical protein